MFSKDWFYIYYYRNKYILKEIKNKDYDKLLYYIYYIIPNNNLIKLIINKFNNTNIINDLIVSACKNQNIDLVKFILKKEISKDILDKCMIKSIYNNNFDIINLLINNEANNFDEYLINSCKFGKIECVKLFLKYFKNEYSETLDVCFEKTSREGYFEILKLIIEFIDSREFDWNLGLKNAFIKGDIDIVKYLVKKGANNFNLPFEVMLGSNDKYFKVLRFLLENKNININFNRELYFIIELSTIKFINIIFEYIDDLTCIDFNNCLYKSIQYNRLQFVKLFIEYIDKFNIDIDLYKCLEMLENKNKEIKKIIINYIKKIKKLFYLFIQK